MKLKIHAIMDTKAGAFMTPRFSLSNSAAVRSFIDESNDPQTMISRHPEDFCLFELGEFDATSGVLSVLSAPHSLGIAANYKQSSTNNVQ